MALSPDTPNEAFLREVDENLRRDQMQDFGRRYGKWLIAALVLLLTAIGGYLYWQDRQAKAAAAQSEELSAIFTDIGAGKAAASDQRLQRLAQADNDLVQTLALLTQAATALEKNDRKTAIARYQAVAEGDAPDSYRDLALVRSTALQFDTLKPADVVARLQPLVNAGDPYFPSAGELTAMAYLKQGQKQQAARLFAAIAADKQAPASARSRAAQIAGTLGVDASASLPDSIEQE